MSNKPKVLVLGATGFIGRHLVRYLIENDCVSALRAVDKTPPQMAWLNHQHMTAFDSDKVEFCSANLINAASCKNAFASASSATGDDDLHWDYVFNCAAETRLGQIDAVYNDGIYKLSTNCINESIRHGVCRYIELSSGNVLSSEQWPITEDCIAKPWTQIAQQKVKVEQELDKRRNELNYTILRLPLVYGKGDRKGLTPRIVIAALYKYLGEPMKLLWNQGMKLNTVHVDDVVNAAIELAFNPKANHQCYNIVDDSESTQGSISDILADIFNIKVDYWGVAVSKLAKLNMSAVVDEINDKHMGPWAELCQTDKTENTPLTPYMDEELLHHKHLNLSNEKLKNTGYSLRVPLMTTEKIEEIINDFIEQKLLPRSMTH